MESKLNQWIGKEGVMRYGEPTLTFNYYNETKSIHQKSYALWNWKDKTLTLTAWLRYKSIIDSNKTKTKCSRALKDLFKPVNQMTVIGTECLKSSGTFVVNFQYFCKLDRRPEPDAMIKALEIFKENQVLMSRAEYEKRRLDAWHSGAYENMNDNY